MDRLRMLKGEKLQLVEGIHEEYGCYSAPRLEALAKEAGGPWQQARKGFSAEAHCGATITKDAMLAYYASKLAASRG